MKENITLNVNDLKRIIEKAEENCKYDASLSLCLEITKEHEFDTHTTPDSITVIQLSNYSECNGKVIYTNF